VLFWLLLTAFAWASLPCGLGAIVYGVATKKRRFVICGAVGPVVLWAFWLFTVAMEKSAGGEFY
jgi:hypothetical protein